VRGQGYLATSIALWLRRLSPRARIVTDPVPPVIASPRALCGHLRGRREGTVYTATFIDSIVYPRLAEGVAEEVVEVAVREPALSVEMLREAAAEEGIVLPASALSVQLALCARDKRLFRVRPGPLPLSDEVARPLWELLEAQGLVDEGPPSLAGFSDGLVEVAVRTGAYTASFKVPVFLDENIEQVAALIACKVFGREVSDPPRMVILDSGDRVFFEIGASEGDSSAKLRVGGDGFVRLVYSRSFERVVGVRGIVDRRLAGGVLDSSIVLLVGQGDLCKKVPALAAARTSLLAGCPALRGLLSLAARLCI